jgi:hypothetical protein
MKLYLKAIFVFLLSIFSIVVSAQTAVVRGKVTDGKNGQPIIYTHIQLAKTSYGSVTDEKGFYTITNVPPGNYTLVVTYIGYDTVRLNVELEVDKILIENIELFEASYTLEGAEVFAQSEAQKINTQTSVTKVTTKQINKIPTVGGEADIAQYLQVIPGVVFTGDQGGQLYIRGGTPVQNKVLLDGMIVYNPFHSIGLFSVFDSDIISNADIYTGGFGAEYGGRISSVMDITTRYGNNRRTAGKVSMSSFGAKILLEGPIVKHQKDKGSLSYLISAKKSYINSAAKTFYPYVNDGGGLPFSYGDYYGKLSFNSSKGSKVDVFGFNFNDAVSYQTINNYEWNSSGGGANIVLVPETSPMMIDAGFAFSNYRIELQDGNIRPRSSQINGFNMKLAFSYFYGKNSLKYGIEMKGFNTDFEFYNSLNRQIVQSESTTEVAVFATYKMTFGKLFPNKPNSNIARFIIHPGIRLQHYASLDNSSLEPRLSAKWNATDFLRFKFATGLYSQNLISTSSDRDVVNLFFGFISGPENLQKEFNGEELTHKLQKASHFVLGSEVDINDYVTVNIEAYYKYFPQLTNINRNKIFDDNQNYLDKPDVLKKDFIIEEGDAYGLDFNLKLDYKKFYLWTVYSLGYSNRYDGLLEYVPHFDRRHNINLLATYEIGDRKLWELNARWNFGSGFPFTPTAGNYENVTFEDGIGTDYSKLEINLSVTNVYNRNNIFYIDRVTNQRIDQLPIMPSLGISLTF